jgi:hypothetical protein
MLAWAAAARGRRATATGVPKRAASKAAVAEATVPPLARAEDARCRGLDTRLTRRGRPPAIVRATVAR